MAATETKPEANEVEEHSEPLICETTVLRVSLHCEGCKRKVKKILHGIDGVYDINIDLRQQKVVVTGNVNSETLIKKLTKTGKHAELWPEQGKSKKKKQGKPENKEKHGDPESSSEEIEQSGENDNETGKVKVVDVDTSKNVEGTSSNTAKNSDGCGGVNVNKANEGCATGKTGVQFQEPKPEVRQQTVILTAVPVTEKKVSVAVQVPNENEAPANDEKTGGSTNSAGKKKKKKGKANNNNGNEGATATVTVEHSGDAPANGGSGNPSQGHVTHVHGRGHPGSVPIPSLANESPPRHHIHHQYPPHYCAPPPPAPVCTVSYHTAYPSSSSSSSSYGAAYYAPPQPYSYAHVVHPHPGTEMEPKPYTYEPESYASSQPSDSFELFSDENPNACSVM